MGVDLTLLVIEGHGSSHTYANTRIELHRQRELWDALSAPLVNERPCGTIIMYTHKGYGPVTEDPGGKPIGILLADELADAMQAFDEKPDDSLYQPNRAAMAYCRALPPGTNIALYWH